MHAVGLQSLAPEVELSYSWLPTRASDKKEEVIVKADDAAVAEDTPQEQFHHQGDERNQIGGPSNASHTQHQQPSDEAAPPPGVCYQYYYHGECDRSGCPYRHAKPSVNHQPLHHQRRSYAEHDEQYGSSQIRNGSGTPRSLADEQRQGSYSSSAGYYEQRDASVSGSQSRRSPYPHTTTRFDNHNNDNEYFGADRTYRPRGFQASKPCFSYQRGGYCKFGSQCAFSHDMDDCSLPR
jgi:hypothetical protein